MTQTTSNTTPRILAVTFGNGTNQARTIKTLKKAGFRYDGTSKTWTGDRDPCYLAEIDDLVRSGCVREVAE